jgi:hypothetical protein
MIPSALKTGASGGISLARNPYAEALFKSVASVSGCACRLYYLHVALL